MRRRMLNSMKQMRQTTPFVTTAVARSVHVSAIVTLHPKFKLATGSRIGTGAVGRARLACVPTARQWSVRQPLRQ
jgi:hypothetical protein